MLNLSKLNRLVKPVKDYIVPAGGTVTEVEDWGKKKLAYDIQKMSEGSCMAPPRTF